MVGAGILGMAVAREAAAKLPEADITVFDKAEHLAAHQSSHTSGIVDAGLDRTPGSAEAQLARRGVEMLVPFVSERGIPYRECGQLIVAQTTDEADRLEEAFSRAKNNGIPGVRLLERREIREIEPAARGVLALYSPHTAVTDFAALTQAFASDVRAAGGTFRFSTEVTDFDSMSNEVRLRGRRVDVREGGDTEGNDRDHGGHETESVRGSRENQGEDDQGTADGEEPGAEELADQVNEAPRTYRGEEAGGPVIGVGEELRSRFGDQDWFKQIENTLGDWTEKFSSSWSPGPNTHPPRRSPDEAVRDEESLGSFDIVIVCAGLQADRLAESAGLQAEPRIVPFTSDYYEMPASAADSEAETVRGIIGSVPDPDAPFAETSIVRGVNGSLVLGPNTFVSMGREKYGKRGFDLGDMSATVRFKGFWKFAAQTARTAAHGVKTVVSKSAFIADVQKYVPSLNPESLASGRRGVRAQAMTEEGALLDELTVTTRGRLTMVRSVPKWGATSALAIAERVVDRALTNHKH